MPAQRQGGNDGSPGVAYSSNRPTDRSKVFQHLYQEDMERRSRQELRRQEAARKVASEAAAIRSTYIRKGSPDELERAGTRLYQQASQRELRRLDRKKAAG